MRRRPRLEHPALVRLCHWLAALAVTMLIASGLEIFAAFASFGDKVPERDLFMPPEAVRLGGWLGGALQWHITCAWVLLGAGFTYVAYQTASGNYRQVLFARSDVDGVWPVLRHYMLVGPKPPERGTYNPLQKLAYTAAIGLGAGLAATGLALYKPVQLSWLIAAFGGFRLTRIWHFLAMCGLLVFVSGHLVMVALHGWSNFASMWTGSKGETPTFGSLDSDRKCATFIRPWSRLVQSRISASRSSGHGRVKCGRDSSTREM